MSPQAPKAERSLIALERVTKRFPGVVALDDVSLELFPGEVHVLLGENGAGKSTLISLLAGMQQPDAGRLLLEGMPHRLASPRAALALGIGTVYQHSTLVPSLTIADNLILGASWRSRLDRRRIRERLAYICHMLGISLPEDAVLSSLSLGQQQLVEIIKALWRGGRLLVLDEPTSMLGPEEVAHLREVADRLRQRGTAILFITHKLTEALDFGDRISVLRSGRKVGCWTPNDLAGLGRKETIEQITTRMFGSEGEATTSEPFHHRRPNPRQAPVVLRVEGLRAFAAPDEPRVEDVSFTLRAGEILGIAGVEGNGQKQLAEALAGQRLCVAGTIKLAGQPLQHLGVAARQKQGLRYLSDDRLGEAGVAHYPITLNLLLKRIGDAPFWHHGIERREQMEAHAARLISRHEIRTRGPHTPLGQLSGGNVQKVLLARELDGEPRVVIYNKPTYGLDIRNIKGARQAIADQAALGVASLVISPDLDELLELCDRVAVMSRGKLVGSLQGSALTRRQIGELMIGSRSAA